MMNKDEKFEWYSKRFRQFENRYGIYSEHCLKPLTPFQRFIARLFGICWAPKHPEHPEDN